VCYHEYEGLKMKKGTNNFTLFTGKKETPLSEKVFQYPAREYVAEAVARLKEGKYWNIGKQKWILREITEEEFDEIMGDFEK